jgi:hypothetical protein
VHENTWASLNAPLQSDFNSAKLASYSSASWKTGENVIRRTLQVSSFFMLAAVFIKLVPTSARADEIPKGWEASNMKVIGYSDLNGHEAFKMAIKRVGDRWYLYLAHFVAGGYTIVDVTDPIQKS